MVDVLLFHHVQGLTDGVVAFADDLRAAGHVVHTPDLYEGKVFDSIEAGMAHADALGDDAMTRRADAAAAALPDALVYAGISSGVMAAQRLAQTRDGARGALLYESCIPISGEWSFGPWPAGVPVQIHGMEADPFFGEGGDLEAARELVDSVGPELAELFVYSGDQHLFIDRSLDSYRADAADSVAERTLAFLDRL
jgi:dienelactone hydrolase